MSPVSRTWQRYCRTCYAWLRFGHALSVMRATKLVRERLHGAH